MKQSTCRNVALIIICAATFLQSSAVQAGTVTNIGDLFPTGAGGTSGLPDLHYKLIAEPFHAPNKAMVASTVPSSWLSAPAGSAWLSPFANAKTEAPRGNYIYQLSFDLKDSGGNDMVASTMSLSAQFASEDQVTILFNGNFVDSDPVGTHHGRGMQMFSFTIDDGFIAGLNTLDFIVLNNQNNYSDCDSASPTGLLVTDFVSSGELATVPEPGTWAMLALGLSAFAAIQIRSRFAQAKLG